MSTLLVFFAFCALTVATWRVQGSAFVRGRSVGDWWLDGTGLFVQGMLVPLGQLWLMLVLWQALFPSCRGSWALPGWAAFALNVVGVDYLYYWNHRLLHQARLWPLHAVHHSSDRLDVLATARNSLWTPLFILYLWVNALVAYLLETPEPFLLGAAVTAALDLWRHSGLGPREGGRLDRVLAWVLTTPSVHAWHHSREDTHANFGANFTWWDRLHGTFHAPHAAPKALGVVLEGGALSRWFWPYSGARR